MNFLSISVITPSYNQAKYLPKCIDSVDAQTFQPIEHLVFDPGSTDESLAIVSRHKKTTLINEPDNGQGDAITKGLKKAKGDIIAWINSDDFYASPQVFQKVIDRFMCSDAPDIVYGKGVFLDSDGNKFRDAYVNNKPKTLKNQLQRECGILQPSLFFRRNIVEKIGYVSDSLDYCMDYEYWIRAIKANIEFVFLDEILSFATYHPDNKTFGSRNKSYDEVCEMLKIHFGYVNIRWIERYAEFNVEGFDGVLVHPGNTKVRSKNEVNREIRRLLVCYNYDYDTLQLMLSKKKESPISETLSSMKKYNIPIEKHCHLTSLKSKHEKNKILYTVGKRRWAYKQEWKNAQLSKTEKMFLDLKENRKNDVCIIVGNGPSLNLIDLELLEKQDVIISNYAYLNEELLNYATFHTVVNYLVAEQGAHQINKITNLIKVYPYWLSYCLHESFNTFYVNAIGYPEFSKDIIKNISWRHTVSFFNMHIAYWLGYKKVLLIGFDHSYIQSSTLKEQDITICEGDDFNHFNPKYFKGKKWQAANTDNMEAMYQLAKTAFEEDQRVIINCTVGGNLELFPRSDLSYELNSLNNENNSLPIKTVSLKELALNTQSDYNNNSKQFDFEKDKPIISVAIPAYNREKELKICIDSFVKQVSKDIENLIEIIIVDDCSPSKTLFPMLCEYSKKYPYIKTKRNEKNLGLEKNLINCTRACSGKYLWIFGDDDYLENDTLQYLLDVITKYKTKYFILNKTRRNSDLSSILTSNLMNVRYDRNIKYNSFLSFVKSWGLISFSGFITVNIYDRESFLSIDYKKYFDLIHYPHLGVAVEAFHDEPCVLIGKPIVCQRTHTQNEKIKWYTKAKHSPFQSVYQYRDAKYFSFNFIYFFLILIEKKAITYRDIKDINESTIINGRIIDFIFNNILLRIKLKIPITEKEFITAIDFFNHLDKKISKKIELIKKEYKMPTHCDQLISKKQNTISIEKRIIEIKKQTELILYELCPHILHKKKNIKNNDQYPILNTFNQNTYFFDEIKVAYNFLLSNYESKVMIDVGAHHGSSLLEFANSNWKIFAFEPDIANYKILNENCKIFNQVFIDLRAVSNTNGLRKCFYKSEISSGISSLIPFHESHIEYCQVETVTLSNYVKEKEIKHIDFLKIDTEGNDLFVLKGFPWDKIRPIIIIAEFEDAKTLQLGYSFEDLTNYIKEQGYNLLISEWHPIIKYGITHRWNMLHTYPCNLDNNKGWGNIIALRNDFDLIELIKCL